jgi:hypothetical protein
MANTEIKPTALDALRTLPFVSEAANGDVAFWDTESVDHDPTDISLGEMYGRLTLDIAKRFDMPVLLAVVMRDMLQCGRFTGVEAGFLATIACAAKAGSMH